MVKEFTVLEKIPEPPKPNVPRAILTAFILSIVLTLGYVMFTHKDPATLLSLSLYKDPISSINFPSYSYYIDESVSPSCQARSELLLSKSFGKVIVDISK